MAFRFPSCKGQMEEVGSLVLTLWSATHIDHWFISNTGDCRPTEAQLLVCGISGIYLWSKPWPMNAVVCLLPGSRLCWPHQWRVRITQSFPMQPGTILTKGKNTREEWGIQSLFLLLLLREGRGDEDEREAEVPASVKTYFLDPSSKVWKGTGRFLSFSTTGCLPFPKRKVPSKWGSIKWVPHKL